MTEGFFNAQEIEMQDPRDLTVLLVGPPGSGKSSMAKTFPTPGLVIDTSKEAKSYRGKDFDIIQIPKTPAGFNKIKNVLKQLHGKTLKDPPIPADKLRKYETYILDNTTGLSDICMEQALMLDAQRDIGDTPMWNVHYKASANMFGGITRQFLELPGHKVVTCHTEMHKEEGTGKVFLMPLLPGKLPNKFADPFDEVLYLFSKTEGGETKFYAQTVMRGHYKARSRTSGTERLLPEYIPNEFDYLVGKKTFKPKATK